VSDSGYNAADTAAAPTNFALAFDTNALQLFRCLGFEYISLAAAPAMSLIRQLFQPFLAA